MKKFFASVEKICCEFYPAFYIYHRIYKNVMRNEIKLANITSKDVVLNIGCGAVPFTALHIVQMTGAKVIALDKDKEAVEKAKKCLSKYKMQKNIEIVVGDGIVENLPDFTVAIIALHVKEKAKMLENLKLAKKTGTRVIFRQPAAGYEEEYGCLPDNYIPNCKISQKMKAFNESHLYLIE
ncbi:class I SAM-dependent methyltransferase [Proteinivorax hydrogeniformans]|uniref:Class I SAM-dependent methyltransferase n=1 Tax=Proteinivorax hydrogeniformans TaxID=1826727 RepID=A0AAU8HVC2_9FIRM